MKKKIIDVSGYGHSGKGILTDFFREFSSIYVQDHLFEFNLLRIQGGLIDLKHNLYDNWSPIRSDAAIRRFHQLILRLGTQAKIYNFKSIGLASGNNYNSFFNDSFIDISEKFINKLIVLKGYKSWTFRKVDDSFFKTFIHRIFRINNIEYDFNLVSSENFLSITKDYLNELFSNVGNKNSEIIVTNNMIEPYNPSYSLELFHNAKSIIISRDPRDTYASLYVNNNNTFVPNYLKKKKLWKQKESFLMANNIKSFIKQQKVLLSFNNNNDCKNVMRLSFEDIVLNYDKIKNKILKFVDMKVSDHKHPRKYFNPKISKKNIGIWKKIKDDPNISLIEKNLKEYCFDY